MIPFQNGAYGPNQLPTIPPTQILVEISIHVPSRYDVEMICSYEVRLCWGIAHKVLMSQVDPTPAQVASQDWPGTELKIQVTPYEGARVGTVVGRDVDG